ncbi:Rid family detoxifying hydrolase [Eupransor demetentiae]|uniref:YjgF/YER057c/UK114 family (RidA) n=1 Tax=Eupransor demetentiae TaxID=3109584 RepID=A0ABM9N3H9_9LACO|nr:Enamine deaminase RidA [Lactobacillaceae bacterium LMG 33000]
MKKAYQTDAAPEALGPYSQAVQSGQTLYCSGQIGLDPKTKSLAPTLGQQAQQALKNVGAVLKSAGLTPDNVVKTTIFMTNVADFALVNLVYADFFAEVKTLPARSTVQVAALPAGALVEIEVQAEF